MDERAMTPRPMSRQAASAPHSLRTCARWAIAAALACSILAPRSGWAEPILTFGDVTLSSIAGVITGSDPESEVETRPPGEFAEVSQLILPGWSPYPTSTSPVPQGFISTLMRTDGFGGVGISGIQGIGIGALADAAYSQRITNTGDEDARPFFEFIVPTIEASVLVIGGIDPMREIRSRAFAELTVNHIAADGTILAVDQPIFDFNVDVVRVGAGVDNLDITISPDLFDALGNGTPITTGAVRGVQFDSFGGVRRLPTLLPGERLDISYNLNAAIFNFLSIDEIGYQALVGDPFQVSGPGFRIGLVPEPSTLALLATYLVAVGAVSRSVWSGRPVNKGDILAL
jgi:hypothetical protein